MALLEGLSNEMLSALLSGSAGISILVAAYFSEITVGYGGSPARLVPWAKFGLYPVLILVQATAIVLLLSDRDRPADKRPTLLSIERVVGRTFTNLDSPTHECMAVVLYRSELSDNGVRSLIAHEFDEGGLDDPDRATYFYLGKKFENECNVDWR